MEPVPEAKTETVFALDTVVSITYYDAKDKDAVGRALESLERYEKIFSRKDPDSELSKVNASGGSPVPVSEALFTVLNAAWQLSEQTDGAFDCTLGAVSDLYDFTGTPRIPSEAEINDCLAHAGYEKVTLNAENRTVTKTDSGLLIDLGAIAKGYIADKLKEELLSAGVKRAIINLGGNIQLIGNKNGVAGEYYASTKTDGMYVIGIRDPDSETPLTKLYLADLSVVTSGTYERCFYDGGVLYHHILDAKTGLPVRNGLLSVSVVAANSMTADALSTACFVLGEEKSKELLVHYPAARVLFADEDKELTNLP